MDFRDIQRMHEQFAQPRPSFTIEVVPSRPRRSSLPAPGNLARATWTRLRTVVLILAGAGIAAGVGMYAARLVAHATPSSSIQA